MYFLIFTSNDFLKESGGALLVKWLSLQERGLADRVQILDKAVSVLLVANTLRKGWNPSIFLPAMSK